MVVPVATPPSPRTPLLLVALAFGATAALLVAQTLAFHLVAWDSSAIGTLSALLRALFLVADVAVVVAFVALARAARAAREDMAIGGLVWNGVGLAVYVACAGAFGLLARILGDSAAAVQAISSKMGAAEPLLSLGTALLMGLTLTALGPRRALPFMIALSASIAAALAFRVARVVDPSPRSLMGAWVSWGVEVGRPAVIALFALSVARGQEAERPANDAGAGPYRAGAQGATPTIPAEIPDPRTAAALRECASALTLYRAAFLARIGLSILTSLVIVAASLERSANAPVLLLAPVFSLITAGLIALSLVKLRRLPRASGARSLALAATAFAGLAALTDAALVVYASSLAPLTSYSARRQLGDVVALEWPIVALAMGVSAVLAASALGRVGDTLGERALATRARWVQGLAVATGAGLLGLLFAWVAQDPERWTHARSSAGNLVLVVHVLIAMPSVFAVIVVHTLLVGSGKKALLGYADRRAG